MLEIIFNGLFWFSAIFLIWTYAGYPAFLVLLSPLLKKHHYLNQRFFPKVTLMIMSYNEEKSIIKKIENTLELDYPKDKLEIFIVDSASTDNTKRIVKNFIRKHKKTGIRLIAQPKREGKASGINFGMKHASGEIIMITDANAMLSKNAVKNIVRHFDDQKVGGVCGRFEARDIKGTSVGAGGEMYWKIEQMLRRGESNLDSCIHMSGEITAVRKDLLKEVDTTSLAEDFDMAVSIRKAGKRIIYEPFAIAYEPAPTNIEDLKMQKRRIVTGTLQVLKKYWYMLFNLRYGFYGFMILTSHKLFQLLTPFVLALFVIATIGLYFIAFTGFMHLVVVVEITGIIFGILSFFLTKTDVFKHNKALNFVKYFLASNWIVVMGWIDFIKGKKIVKWEKIESSREF